MKKPHKIEWTDNPVFNTFTGAVSVDLHIVSSRGNRRVMRVTFDQHDMRDIGRHFHNGLDTVESNMKRTRRILSGEE